MYVEKTTRDSRMRIGSKSVPFFIACVVRKPSLFQTRKRVVCHPLTATDHGYTIILLFTHLLRKNIDHRFDQSQRARSGWSGLRGQERFAQLASRLFFYSIFFPRERKKGPGSRVDPFDPTPASNRLMDKLPRNRS
jgi:hypothetical protein